MTNTEIVEKYLKNGLIDRCLMYQFRKKPAEKKFMEDARQDLILDLLMYDKLEKVEEEGHMNALITAFIRYQIHSTASRYWRRYARPDKITREITRQEENIPDD